MVGLGSSEDADMEQRPESQEGERDRPTSGERVYSRQWGQQVQRAWGRSMSGKFEQQSVTSVAAAEGRRETGVQKRPER